MIPGKKDYLDDQIRYFPLQMIRHRSAAIMQVLPVLAWDQELETVTPYYYKVWLEDFDPD